MSSPLRRVLDAVAAGARTRNDLVVRTGLRSDLVEAALEHLVRLGRLEATVLSSGCPTQGCGSCAAGPADRCSVPVTPPGPVLVQLSLPDR